jgi:hypothetical protein
VRHEIVGPFTHVVVLQNEGEHTELHLDQPVGQWAGWKPSSTKNRLLVSTFFAGSFGRMELTVRDRLAWSTDMTLRSFHTACQKPTPDVENV